MKKSFLMIGLIASTTIACEKSIEIDVPFEPPKLVLNGFLNPDSSISVHLSRSQFVLDNAPLKDITDAQVYIYEGEERLGQMQHQDFGTYTLEGIKPEVGKKYTIQAEKAGFPSISATESIPSRVTVQDIEVDTLGKDQYDNLKIGIEFLLEDIGGQENYYQIHVKERGYRKHYPYYNPREPEEEPEFEWEYFEIQHRLSSTDVAVEQLCTGVYYSCPLVVKDDYFDGKAYRVNIITESYSRHFDPEYHKDIEVVLVVTQIPESYYLYFKTWEVNDEASNTPFAEPAKVFSNVEGGYGIWSAIAPVSYRIDQ